MLNKLISLIISAFIALNSVFGIGGAEQLENLLRDLFSKENITKLYSIQKSDISYYPEEDLEYINNIILVYFADGVDDARRKEIADSINGEYAGEIGIIDQWQIRIEENTLNGISKICNRLKALPEVNAATCDFITDNISPDYIPNDKWGSSSWQTPQNASGYNWYAERINAMGAWEYNKYFKSQVKIGVVDDEIDAYQEDLNGRVFYVSDEVEARSEVNGTHGTGVCGVIGATPNNNLGTTGLAWNSKLYAYDWDAGELNTMTTILAGFTSCVDEAKCKIINFSIGCSGSYSGDMDIFSLGTWDVAICAAMSKLLNAGYDYLVVQSAGNGNSNNDGVDAKNNGLFCSIGKSSASGAYSSMYSELLKHVIIVGATTSGNSITSWSNFGNTVDIYAPGSSIYMPASDSSGRSYYSSASGTSFSAPIVAGVAGIISSINPDLTAVQIKDIICDKSNSTFSVPGYGNIIDANLCAEAAIDSLPKADYTALDAAIAKSPAYNQSYYTVSSWSSYVNALNTAMSINRNLLSENQSVVDSAALALTKAINALTKLADYSALNNVIKTAESLDSDLYIDFSSVTANLSAAKRVSSDLAASRQSSIDSITNRLLNAINNLVKISDIFPVYFEPVEESDTVIDNNNNIIFGLEESLKANDISSGFIEVHDGGNLEISSNSSDFIGTGDEITLYANGDKIKTYTVVIFGDVNGDGICDGNDAVIVSLLAYNIIPPSSVSVDVLLACDCNHDGNIDINDIELIEMSGAFLEKVSQKS